MGNTIKIIIAAFFIPLLANGQKLSSYTIAESSLNLRSSPSIQSEILTKIPYGTNVLCYLYPAKKDTIEGEINSWYKIDYNNFTGYVWGKHLTRNKNIILDYGILFEHQDGTNYNPTLNWYGIYQSTNDDFNILKKVNITLNDKYDSYRDMTYQAVETDLPEKSIFIFGTKKDLTEKEISGTSFDLNYNYQNRQIDYKKTLDESFLYPEERMKLGIVGHKNSLQIKAKDMPYIDSTRNEIYTLYELEVTNGNVHYGEVKVQNISSEIPNRSSANRCAIFKNPRIYWYGDLDQDQKVDIIITSAPMEYQEINESTTLIFLSSEAEQGDFLKMVAKIHNEN